MSAAGTGCAFAMLHPIAPHYSTLLRFDPQNYPKIVGDVAVHPGGRLLATVGRDGAARLWDIDSGDLLHTWDVPVTSWQDPRLAFSPAGGWRRSPVRSARCSPASAPH